MAGSQPTIFLHIGAMKSGTTFLQGLLSANRTNLLDAGFLFPGKTWGEQGLATRDILRGKSIGEPELRARAVGVWEKLSKEMLTYPGRASVFSMEFLSFANKERAGRVVQALADADVHVILTVRDAAGALPAQWQTMCRTGGTVPWPRFVQAASTVVEEGRARGEAARTFRRTQGIPRMLHAWGAWVPPERIHVITVPAAGSDQGILWRRFAAVLGVDPAVASEKPAFANPSIGQASAELMRRINLRLGDVPSLDYKYTLKSHLRIALSRRAATEGRPRLDLPTYRFAMEWNRQVRQAIVDSGADVVGDLEELPTELAPDVAAGLPKELTSPAREELLRAATTARNAMIGLIRNRERELEARGEKALPDEPLDLLTDIPTPVGRWDDSARPVREAVDEIASLCRYAMDLRRRISALPAEAVSR